VTLGEKIGMARVPLHGSRHCAASLLADLGVADADNVIRPGHGASARTRGSCAVYLPARIASPTITWR
jgi:hypothetical protein